MPTATMETAQQTDLDAALKSMESGRMPASVDAMKTVAKLARLQLRVEAPRPQPNRRRRYTDEEKLAIIALADHTSISSAARVNNVAPRLVFSWRKQFGMTR